MAKRAYLRLGGVGTSVISLFGPDFDRISTKFRRRNLVQNFPIFHGSYELEIDNDLFPQRSKPSLVN